MAKYSFPKPYDTAFQASNSSKQAEPGTSGHVHQIGVQSNKQITRIDLSRQALKDLLITPAHIATKLKSWVDLIERNGLEVARGIPGYHDEPLKGKRAGQRSIRLSKNYRAVYTRMQVNGVKRMLVLEVTKHAY